MDESSGHMHRAQKSLLPRKTRTRLAMLLTYSCLFKRKRNNNHTENGADSSLPQYLQTSSHEEQSPSRKYPTILFYAPA